MKKFWIASITLIIFIILMLWTIGVIPKFIGKQIAMRYVKNNYEEMNLEYYYIEFSKEYDDYIVCFRDRENNVYNFKLNSKYFPSSIVFDGVKNSNI